METPQIGLFDADGVAVLSTEPFSQRYAKEHGFNAETLEPFFSKGWSDVLRGKVDLKDHLEQHRNLWGWERDFDELIRMWCESENHPNVELMGTIAQLRRNGVRCYLATNNERNRTDYFRTNMFASSLDGIFSSCEIGYLKPEQEFFAAVLAALDSEANHVAFFDDSDTNVSAASALGMRAYLYKDPRHVRKIFGVNES